MSATWIKVIDELIVEKGEKHKDGFYRAMVTSTEILKKIDVVITEPNHRNVKRVVEMQYPGSSSESIGVNGANGWKLHIKVRTP